MLCLEEVRFCSFHNLLWICFAALFKERKKNASLIMKHSWGGLILLRQKILYFLPNDLFLLLFYCGIIFIIFNLQNDSIHRSRRNLTIEVLKIALGYIRCFSKIFFFFPYAWKIYFEYNSSYINADSVDNFVAQSPSYCKIPDRLQFRFFLKSLIATCLLFLTLTATCKCKLRTFYFLDINNFFMAIWNV